MDNNIINEEKSVNVKYYFCRNCMEHGWTGKTNITLFKCLNKACNSSTTMLFNDPETAIKYFNDNYIWVMCGRKKLIGMNIDGKPEYCNHIWLTKALGNKKRSAQCSKCHSTTSIEKGHKRLLKNLLGTKEQNELVRWIVRLRKPFMKSSYFHKKFPSYEVIQERKKQYIEEQKNANNKSPM